MTGAAAPAGPDRRHRGLDLAILAVAGLVVAAGAGCAAGRLDRPTSTTGRMPRCLGCDSLERHRLTLS